MRVHMSRVLYDRIKAMRGAVPVDDPDRAGQLLSNGKDLTAAGWLSIGPVSAAAGAIASPDGVGTMTQITYSATGGLQIRYRSWTGAITTGQQMLASIWLRAGTLSSVALGVQGATFPANNQSTPLLTLTDTPQLFEFPFTVQQNDSGLFFEVGGGIGPSAEPVLTSTGNIHAWGARLVFV